jgi:hypothetical protein
MTAHENAVNYVADAMHDQWRELYRVQNGDVPRWKKLNADSHKWLANNPAASDHVRSFDGSLDIDIAALSNRQLPAQFSGENTASATSAVNTVLSQPAATPDQLAAVVHDEWIERNASWASAELKRPYAELSEDEQRKDRAIVWLALEAVERFGLRGEGALLRWQILRAKAAAWDAYVDLQVVRLLREPAVTKRHEQDLQAKVEALRELQAGAVT